MEPQDHKAVDPNDKRLYAWLTGETHTIAVGNKKQTYYFEETSNSNTFKPITNNDFILSSPNLTYNGTAQAPLECNIEDIKDEIKLSYYENGVPQPNGAINAGTYTVTANIAETVLQMRLGLSRLILQHLMKIPLKLQHIIKYMTEMNTQL